MTFDEAIERMAEAVWGNQPDCVTWPLAEARAAAEAIGLREMMEALDTRTNTLRAIVQMAKDKPTRTDIWGRAIKGLRHD